MDQRSQVLVATLMGAVTGGVLGWLYLTDRGRDVRQELEPMLDVVVDELEQARHTIVKARDAVSEGRRVVDDLLHSSSGKSG